MNPLLFAHDGAGHFYRLLNFPKGMWDFAQISQAKSLDFLECMEHKLEDDEVFYLPLTDKHPSLVPYLNCIKNTPACLDIPNKKTLEKLQCFYVFTEQAENERKGAKIKLYIQRIMPAMRLNKHQCLLLKGALYVEKTPSICIRNQTDLFWDEEAGKIYFKKYTDLNALFHTLAQGYLNTDGVSLEMLKDHGIQVSLTLKDPSLSQKVKIRKIATLMEKLGTSKDRQQYHSYAKKYGLNAFGQSFKIDKTKDIDTLLHLLNKAYYTTEIGGEQRVATAFYTHKQKGH